MKDTDFMKIALEEAKKAFSLNEVPIGCVLVCNGKMVAKAHNRKTLDQIATYHAEVLAIEEACRKLGSWYLDQCCLYVTVEPCLMCTGAILQSRIGKVIYGVHNEDFGYLSKLENHKIEVISGVMKEECRQLLTSFFQKRRKENEKKESELF